MKWKMLLVLMISFSSIATYASKEEKKYRKLVENYDVAVEARAVDSCALASFWATALDNNERLHKFVRSFQDDKKGAKKVLQKKAKLPHLYPEYDEDIVSEMQESCDSLLSRMGIADQYVNCSLHVVSSLDPNVYTVLTDNGFAICITTALYTKKGVDNDVLMGYVAAEFAHGVLRHHDRALFAEAQAGYGGGFWLGLGLMVNGFGISAPIPVGTPGGRKYFIPSGDSMQKYVFSYLDEQVFEADLFGLRFMENMGKGEKYLDGLRILGTEYDEKFGDYFNRPNVASRIDFLSYVHQNPELVNTFNDKLRKKQPKMKPEDDEEEEVANVEVEDKAKAKAKESEDKPKKKKKKVKKNLDWAIDTM